MSWVDDKITKSLEKLDFYNEDVYSPRFQKYILFIIDKVVPFVSTLAGAIAFFYIIFKIKNSRGFEDAVIILLVILIIVLRSVRNIMKRFK